DLCDEVKDAGNPLQVLSRFRFFELQIFAKPLPGLFTQIEDSQLEELEGSMRSTQRYFRVYTDLKKQDYELTVLNFLKRYYNAPQAEKAEVANELTQYLQKQTTSPNSKWPGLEEISLWAKSKVEKMPIIDILTKRL
ncbi:MAG: hypothetical protein AAFV25_22460, partial [Bacteroidota bacterium]